MRPVRALAIWFTKWPRILAVALICVWVAILHGLSWLPRSPPQVEPSMGAAVLHNWLHAPVYGSLALWFLLAQRRAREIAIEKRACILAFVASAAIGLSDEIHQAMVPWRDGDPVDWLTDLLAAAGTLAIMHQAWHGGSEARLLAHIGVLLALTVSSATLAASLA